jgi:hypothetical protein
MGSELRTKIFPLHLTDIERFLLDDDRPSHPMAFFIEMAFQGEIDTDAFQAAMTAALYRHPLLVARIGPAKNKSVCWLKPDGTQPQVDIAPLGTPINPRDGEWIDLKKEVGLRVWLRVGANRTIANFQFHHACCDGIGAYRFLGDLLAFYAARTDAKADAAEIPEISLRRLRSRADRCRFMSRTSNRGELIRSSIKHWYQIMGKGCTPLAIDRASQPLTPAPFPGLCSATFTQRQTNQLRDAAKELGLMMNDLLLMELFQVLDDWNTRLVGPRPRNRYRVMMPVDLRSTDDFETPAANVIGYTFLSRSRRELADRQQLAAGIREETAGIKHNRLGERFNDMVAMADHVPRIKQMALRMPRTLCTAVLSNIGDPSRRFLAKFKRQEGCVVCGDLLLERISGYPPLRPKSRASFSIVTYRRELTIGLRCDPHFYSLGDTERLLGMFATALRRHLPVEPADLKVSQRETTEILTA